MAFEIESSTRFCSSFSLQPVGQDYKPDCQGGVYSRCLISHGYEILLRSRPSGDTICASSIFLARSKGFQCGSLCPSPRSYARRVLSRRHYSRWRCFRVLLPPAHRRHYHHPQLSARWLAARASRRTKPVHAPAPSHATSVSRQAVRGRGSHQSRLMGRATDRFISIIKG